MLALATQPANASSLADRIAEAIATRIVRGDLAPDTPIRQDHVAAEFGASHVPVREAFRKLEPRGLVIAAPRRGVRVAPLDAGSVLEVIEMRAALETLALRHAMPNLTATDLESAAAALAEGEASADIAVWEAANRRFHGALMRPCRMPRLLAAIDDLHQASARYLFATWKGLAWQPRSDAEHHAILKACRAGDVEAATTATSDHILEAGRALAVTLGST